MIRNSPVLVHLHLGDHHVRGVDGEGHRGTVGLLTDHALDVYDPLLAVDLGDLALTALVGATDNEDLVVLVDGDGADLRSRSRGARGVSDTELGDLHLDRSSRYSSLKAAGLDCN